MGLTRVGYRLDLDLSSVPAANQLPSDLPSVPLPKSLSPLPSRVHRIRYCITEYISRDAVLQMMRGQGGEPKVKLQGSDLSVAPPLSLLHFPAASSTPCDALLPCCCASLSLGLYRSEQVAH